MTPLHWPVKQLADKKLQDFRSEDGLYALIQSQHDDVSSSLPATPFKRRKALGRSHTSTSTPKAPPIPTNIKGKDLFDAQLWKDPVSTSVFYKFIASLRKTIREDVNHTTPTHRFIKTLRDRRKLVRCYTQNIDGLDSRLDLCTDLGRGKGNRSRFMKKAMDKPGAPMRSMPGGDLDSGCEVIQLHGELETLRCTLCQQTCQWKDENEARLLVGSAPTCHFCTITNEDRKNRGKRSTRVGTLRPNIVLYGEEHPSADAVGAITAHDLTLAPDVLLILGTSMHVHGLKVLVKEFAKAVHARAGGKGKVIFVNHSKPCGGVWKDVIDYWVGMDCDEWVGAMRKHRPDIWQIQGELKPRIIKNLGAKAPKSITTPSHTAGADEDKENYVNEPNTTPKKPRSVPIVLVSPKHRQPLEDRGSPKRQRALQEEQPTLISRLKEAVANTKPLSEQTMLNDQLQLPTPPSSGQRAHYQTPSHKRLRPSSEEDLPATPLKKRKAKISIWED